MSAPGGRRFSSSQEDVIRIDLRNCPIAFLEGVPFFHPPDWNGGVVTSHLGLVCEENNLKMEEQQDKKSLSP